MKECYFCNSAIPEDATVCPMCGLDLTEVETKATSVEEVQPETPSYNPNKKIESRREENGLNFKKIAASFLHYFTYHFKKVSQPVHIDYRAERHPFYGYVNMIVAAFFTAGIITRVATALDGAYQFMLDLSILPTLTFEISAFEWFWKLSVFFIIYFFLYSLLAYLFKKLSTKQTLNFHNWVTQFTSMNALFFLILCLAFLLAMVVPIGLAVPVLLIVVLHNLSYLVAFNSTLYSDGREGKESKTFYQALLGMSLHTIIMAFAAYLLIKI